MSLRPTLPGLESFLSGGEITGTQPPAEKEDPAESRQGVSADADLSVNRGPVSAQKPVDPAFCSGPRAPPVSVTPRTTASRAAHQPGRSAPSKRAENIPENSRTSKSEASRVCGAVALV